MAADNASNSVEQPMTLQELSDYLNIPTYRLLTWETFYPLITSTQGPDGQRIFSPDTIKLFKEVARLTYEEKMKTHRIRDILQGMHRDQRQSALSGGPLGGMGIGATSSNNNNHMASNEAVRRKHQKPAAPKFNAAPDLALVNELERTRDFLRVMEMGLSLQAESFALRNSDSN